MKTQHFPLNTEGRDDVAKRFTLADGDVLLEKPVYVSAVQLRCPCYPGLPSYTYYEFTLGLPGGKSVAYRSKWQVEVERERDRLLQFDWNTNGE